MDLLSDGNRKEIAVVVVAFVSLALTIPTVAGAASTVWANGGLLRSLSGAIAGVGGVTLDFPVVVLGGLLAGWFALFLVDGTKRVQAALVLLVAVVALLPTLGDLGRVLGAIQRESVTFAAALVVGLLSGGVTSQIYGVKVPNQLSIRERLQWIQFPTASRAFFYTVSVLVLLAALQYVQYATSIVDTLVTLLAGGVAVFALSVFMTYEYQKSVVTITAENDRRAEPYVLGGLFAHAESEREGFPIEGNHLLRQAVTAADESALPDGFGAPVSFGFLAGDVTERTAKVTTEGFSTRDVNRNRLENRLRERNGGGARVKQLLRWVRHHLVLILPAVVRDAMAYQEGTVLNRLDHADTVLLLTRTPGKDDTPEEADLYGLLTELYGDDPSTDVVIATSEAREPADAFDEGISLTDGVFPSEVADRLGIDADGVGERYAIVPTNRFDGGDEGFDVLIETL
ncbi:hypothetical protein [Halolamina salina]|uniref:DUF389 domain-containing protein n=1 Tax=Halolamina salina TaxID=1220023 RepID=A0ABD6B388_9EURY